MTIPSSRSLILWISVFSITSPSADFRRLRKTSDFFGRLRTSSGIFGNDCVVFKNPSTPRIKISRLYLRKSWQVYYYSYTFVHFYLFGENFLSLKRKRKLKIIIIIIIIIIIENQPRLNQNST